MINSRFILILNYIQIDIDYKKITRSKKIFTIRTIYLGKLTKNMRMKAEKLCDS